jgi:ribosome-associated protein
MTQHLDAAIRAAQDRKAVDLNILSLKGVCSFTDFFLICSGTSTRHTQAICDGIREKLKGAGLSPTHVEGYSQAEWILLDYLNFVVHIFTDRARHFYDLERLWKTASRIPVPENGQ